MVILWVIVDYFCGIGVLSAEELVRLSIIYYLGHYSSLF